MAWAIEQQETRDPESRLVLICLANYASADGRNAFPAIDRLCRDTGLSESTVRRHLKKLIEAILIRRGNQAIAAAHIERADRRPVVYDVLIQRGVPVIPRGDERGVTETPRDGDGVSKTDSRGVKQGATGCQALTPDPSSDPSLNRKSARAIPTGSCANPQNPEASKERREEFKRQLRVLARMPVSKRQS